MTEGAESSEKAEMAKQASVALKAVVPVILRGAVARNRATRPGKVDGSGLAQGVHLSIQGKGMAMWGKKYAKDKFTHLPHPKDGYSLPDCKDPRARRLLELLVPILYPKKLAQVIVTVGNTIFWGIYW